MKKKKKHVQVKEKKPVGILLCRARKMQLCTYCTGTRGQHFYTPYTNHSKASQPQNFNPRTLSKF